MDKIVYITPDAEVIETLCAEHPLCSSFDDTYGTENIVVEEEGII